MTKGRSTCKLLKSIRQQIADANGISYRPKECQHKGDCAGTCPACEEEIRYLERELKARKGNGFGMKVAGIAAGICATVMPMTAAAQAVKPDSTANPPVLVRGMVIDAEDKEPVIGASVVIDGTDKGIATNVDGQFALKVPSDTSLVISYIGCKDKKVRVSSLLSSDNNVIILEVSNLSGISCIAGGVVTVVPNYDDVYGHMTYKPKSHMEKNKKKCK